MGLTNCPICDFKALKEDNKDSINYICHKCGQYDISPDAENKISKILDSIEKRMNFSNYIRFSAIDEVNVKLLKGSINIQKPSLDVRVENYMRLITEKAWMGATIPHPFVVFQEAVENQFNRTTKQPMKFDDNLWKNIFALFSTSWCSNINEYRYFIIDYLSHNKKFLEPAGSSGGFKITAIAWEFLENANLRNPKSNTAFMAFQFTGDVKEYNVNVVTKAINKAGYKDDYLLLNDHNNSIYDEIIARIRRSKFVVADLTNGNANVYYEAGFAKGLGKDVVYICEESSLENKDHVKFDVRQYSVIPYKFDEVEKFVKALKSRIEATLGRGKNSDDEQELININK